MPDTIPFSTTLLFSLTVILSLVLFFYASGRKIPVILALSAWTAIQSLVSLSGFYTETHSLPPRFMLAIGPPFLLIIYLFATKSGRKIIENFNPGLITLFHLIRIPVEVVLLLLFLHGAVPRLLTFEGQNFDIFSGITAPFIFWLGYKKNILPKAALVAWNLLCLGLVLNVVIHGILSVQFPFQQFSFDQPNVGVLYFPFALLPALLVPMVIFGHLFCLWGLLFRKPG